MSTQKVSVVTVCYLWRETNLTPEICLAWKEPTPKAVKRAIANVWNGYGGGKEDSDPTIMATTIRELREESGVVARQSDVIPVGTIRYVKKGVPDCICHFSVATVPNADPRPTPEMTKPTWFFTNDLPYGQMLAGDRLTLPHIIEGKCVSGTVTYDDKMEVVFVETYLEITPRP